jgi:hypothetical protein
MLTAYLLSNCRTSVGAVSRDGYDDANYSEDTTDETEGKTYFVARRFNWSHLGNCCLSWSVMIYFGALRPEPLSCSLENGAANTMISFAEKFEACL